MFEAYITNTALYPLMGIEVGTTVHFPMTTQELQAALAKIGIDGKRYSEVFFTSFDSDVLGLYDYLYECENIDELNELGHALLEVRDKGGLETFEAALVLGNHTRSVKDLITVVDNATDEDGKEFYTITTADESVFYLVIDKQKTSENVYFLNTVTVDDLLPLAEQGKEPPKEVTPEPEPKPTEPVEEVPEPEPEKKDSPLLSMLLIGAVVLAGGGIGYYFKIYKPKHEAPDLEDDYCEYEDGELEEIAEEPEDEVTPPWEEDTEE